MWHRRLLYNDILKSIRNLNGRYAGRWGCHPIPKHERVRAWVIPHIGSAWETIKIGKPWLRQQDTSLAVDMLHFQWTFTRQSKQIVHKVGLLFHVWDKAIDGSIYFCSSSSPLTKPPSFLFKRKRQNTTCGPQHFEVNGWLITNERMSVWEIGWQRWLVFYYSLVRFDLSALP